LGLWLLPFGVLVFESGFFPRVLGLLLIVACFAYMADSISLIMLPTPSHAVSMVALTLGGIGELAITLWMIVVGAKSRRKARST